MQYMSAALIAKAKEIRDDGSIVEVVIWELSKPLDPSAHSYKYRLYYGASGMCRAKVITGIWATERKTTASSRLIGFWWTSSVT